MAEQEKHILHKLKDYEVNPPAGFFSKIWEKMWGQANLYIPKQDVPTSFVFEGGSSGDFSEKEIEAFKSLRGFGAAHPDFEFIKPGVQDLIKKPPINTKIIWYKYIGRIAAAVLIILASVLLAYLIHSKNKSEPVASSTSVKIEKTPLLPSAPVIQKNDTATIKNINVAINKTGASIKNSPFTHKFSENHRGAIHVTSRNSVIQIMDNDMFGTLVNYQYKNYISLMKKIQKDKRVQLDNFSYLNISDKMYEILKQMYVTRKNDKPTRKARKIKARLLKWQKADEKYFDKNTSKNPLDVIDLSEFILK